MGSRYTRKDYDRDTEIGEIDKQGKQLIWEEDRSREMRQGRNYRKGSRGEEKVPRHGKQQQGKNQEIKVTTEKSRKGI